MYQTTILQTINNQNNLEKNLANEIIDLNY